MAYHQMDDSSGTGGAGRSLVTGRNVVAVLIVIGLAAFVLQNREQAQLDWLFFSFSTGLWVLLAIGLALAFVAGFLMGRSAGKSAFRKDKKK